MGAEIRGRAPRESSSAPVHASIQTNSPRLGGQAANRVKKKAARQLDDALCLHRGGELNRDRVRQGALGEGCAGAIAAGGFKVGALAANYLLAGAR